MDYAIADFDFLVLVHEGFGDIGIMSVLDRRAAEQCGPIRNGFLFRRSREIFPGR